MARSNPDPASADCAQLAHQLLEAVDSLRYRLARHEEPRNGGRQLTWAYSVDDLVGTPASREHPTQHLPQGHSVPAVRDLRTRGLVMPRISDPDRRRWRAAPIR